MAGVAQRSAPVVLRNDAGLLRGIRDGDDAAFAELVRRHGSAMRRVCARIVGPDDADDAQQQALMSAARAVRGGAEIADAGRWLHRLAHNASVDWLRRRPQAGEPLDEGIDGVPQPPDVALGRAALAATVAAIQQLPDAQRRALLLSVFEDRSWEEIARELGTGEGAVRGLLHRARSGLRSAAALAVLPFFALRPRLVHAAELLGRGGEGAGVAKAGAAVAILGVAAGGGAVALHHHGPADPAPRPPLVAAAPAMTARPGRTVALTLPHRPGSAKARRVALPHRPAAVRTATSAPSPAASAAPRVQRPLAAPHHAPAANDPASAHHEPPVAPPSADPAPASAPDPPTTATTAAPDPAPAAAPPPPVQPPAPATMGRVDSFAPYGNGGTLGVALDSGTTVVAFVGEHTAVTCDTVSAGHLVSQAACSPSSIAVGRRIVRADHEANATSGHEVFTAVELVLGA